MFTTTFTIQYERKRLIVEIDDVDGVFDVNAYDFKGEPYAHINRILPHHPLMHAIWVNVACPYEIEIAMMLKDFEQTNCFEQSGFNTYRMFQYKF